MSYNPINWYWSGAPGLYSSATGGLISESLPAYVTWLAYGNFPTPWPTDASTGVATAAALDAVLIAAGLPPTGLAQPTSAALIAHANATQWALATGGYTITVNSVPLLFPTDVVSMSLITGKAARLAQPNPATSFNWQTPTGFVTIAAADFILAATQIADFVQSTFDALDVVFAALTAGTITTIAGIDSAAWPSNVSITSA